jgi:crotonobetainyl-CoA:carnitine CoA-transferase CaiB-like acyl-CoA transferase
VPLTEATACADHRAMTTDSLPLQRFTIVEVNDTGVPLCLRLATSLAAKIAADLGADVLKIEPPGGDPVRYA